MRDDEGCQGNPPSQPRLTLARSRDQYSIPRRASSRTKRVRPLQPPLPPSPSPGAPGGSLPSFHRRHRLSAVSLRASSRARYRRPSQTNPLFLSYGSSLFLPYHPLVAHPPRAVISESPVSVYLRLFPTPCSLSLLGSIQLTSPHLPPLTVLSLSLSLSFSRDEFSLRISFRNAALSSSRLFLSLFVYRYAHGWRTRELEFDKSGGNENARSLGKGRKGETAELHLYGDLYIDINSRL